MDKPTYKQIASIIKHNIEDKINTYKIFFTKSKYSNSPICFEKSCVYIQGKQIVYPPVKEFDIHELYRKFPSLNSESNSNSNSSNDN